MPLTTVFNTFNPAEAQLIRSMLEAANLHPRLNHELSALSMEGYSMAAGGIQVQVFEEEAELARQLIQTPAPQGNDQPPEPPQE